MIMDTRRIQPALEHLAAAWLAEGASAVGCWLDGRYAALWPPQQPAVPPDLAAPLLAQGEMVGALHVWGRPGPHAQQRLAGEALLLAQTLFLEAELHLMTGELVDTQDQLLTLFELSRRLSGYLELDTLLELLTRELTRLTKTNGAWISLASGSGYERLVTCGPPIDTGDLASVVKVLSREGSPVLRNSPADGPLPMAMLNLLWVPITVRNVVVAGGLGLYNKSGAFTAADMKLARALADHVSLRIEQSMLYQEALNQARIQTEMDLARRVQERLLPKRLPQIEGVELAAHAQPAREVGGDFYDVLLRPDGSLLLAIGDVVGKGMSAALLMTMSRTCLRSAAMDYADPAAILQRITRDVYADFAEVESFVTVFVAVLLPQERVLRYANAGHSPVLLLNQGQPPRLLEADAPPVGVLEDSLSRTVTLELASGAVLLLATDGLSETSNSAGELFGYERLGAGLAAVSTASAREIAASVLGQVTAFGGNRPQEDDRTLVICKTTDR